MHSHMARVKKQNDKEKQKQKRKKKGKKNPKPIFQLRNLEYIPQGENNNSPLLQNPCIVPLSEEEASTPHHDHDLSKKRWSYLKVSNQKMTAKSLNLIHIAVIFISFTPHSWHFCLISGLL